MPLKEIISIIMHGVTGNGFLIGLVDGKVS